MQRNVILLTDSYKTAHYKMYPPNTTLTYFYFTSRRKAKWSDTILFALQYVMQEYLSGPVVTQENIDFAESYLDRHIGKGVFNREGWQYILDQHAGTLPLCIKALPEGSRFPTGVPGFVVYNTDPKAYWLPGYLEPLFDQLWYPCTVATQSLEFRKLISSYLVKTGTPELIDYKLHDFGFRGVTCVQQGEIGAAAHLLSFNGIDTMVGDLMLMDYYKSPGRGQSIPAAEHSTITSWGQTREALAYENMLTQFPDGLVAVVSDSYNIYEACDKIWGILLKQKVADRNGTLVIRPDSGDPEETLNKVFNILGERFGFTVNSKGYKVLPPYLRIIQGDGVDYNSVRSILQGMQYRGWSADNIAFGSGGAVLQKMNRDTQDIAYKLCYTQNRFGEISVSKNPVGDPGKQSEGGILGTSWNPVKNVYETVQKDAVWETCALETVYENGDILCPQSYSDIAERVRGYGYAT